MEVRIILSVSMRFLSPDILIRNSLDVSISWEKLTTFKCDFLLSGIIELTLFSCSMSSVKMFRIFLGGNILL